MLRYRNDPRHNGARLRYGCWRRTISGSLMGLNDLNSERSMVKQRPLEAISRPDTWDVFLQQTITVFRRLEFHLMFSVKH